MLRANVHRNENICVDYLRETNVTVTYGRETAIENYWN